MERRWDEGPSKGSPRENGKPERANTKGPKGLLKGRRVCSSGLRGGRVSVFPPKEEIMADNEAGPVARQSLPREKTALLNEAPEQERGGTEGFGEPSISQQHEWLSDPTMKQKKTQCTGKRAVADMVISL